MKAITTLATVTALLSAMASAMSLESCGASDYVSGVSVKADDLVPGKEICSEISGDVLKEIGGGTVEVNANPAGLGTQTREFDICEVAKGCPIKPGHHTFKVCNKAENFPTNIEVQFEVIGKSSNGNTLFCFKGKAVTKSGSKKRRLPSDY
ncbi:hypothetical protein BGW38_008310 [Lunasporangiospora selenospora]|uniref:Phosphatidylglycerol/phosphatidylinositol transfer protein n=1 Tax=Lunasporangiospora selenospora TaxID=979761 RepID=A0A9P6FYB4_9FUNG|nr:hypothetical protein BGW38_008310 [Lunasporangiospora selenospora]